MNDLTALDVIQNLRLDATMAIVKDLGMAVDWDDKSRAIADLIAKDLLHRCNGDFSRAQQFAKSYSLTLTVTLV